MSCKRCCADRIMCPSRIRNSLSSPVGEKICSSDNEGEHSSRCCKASKLLSTNSSNDCGVCRNIKGFNSECAESRKSEAKKGAVNRSSGDRFRYVVNGGGAQWPRTPAVGSQPPAPGHARRQHSTDAGVLLGHPSTLDSAFELAQALKLRRWLHHP